MHADAAVTNQPQRRVLGPDEEEQTLTTAEYELMPRRMLRRARAKLELMRVDMYFEDSPCVLTCSTWSHGDAALTCELSAPDTATPIPPQAHDDGADTPRASPPPPEHAVRIIAILHKPCRVRGTTSHACSLSFVPGAATSAVADLVHAVAAAASVRVFPLKQQTATLVALLRSTRTTEVAFAPPGVSAEAVCRVAAAAAAAPYVPLLASSLRIADFLPDAWCLRIRWHTLALTIHNPHESVSVAVRRTGTRVETLMQLEMTAPPDSWLQPLTLASWAKSPCSHARCIKTIASFARASVPDQPHRQLLGQLAQHLRPARVG